MKNILLLSAGRRVELAQAIMGEIKMRGLDSKLFATDITPELSSACQIVDQFFKAPPITSALYADFLMSLCRIKDIGVVIPTIDTELLLLSKCREAFAAEGIHLIISDEKLIHKCRDKRLSTDLFDAIEIGTPEIYQKTKIRYPCFAKPYDGSCSVGARYIPSVELLPEALLNDEKMMFMEFIDSSFDEYTVDAYFDRNGFLKCFVPRLRIETRAGEVSKGVTRRNLVYDYLVKRLVKLEGARGCITLQLFINEGLNRFAALEINPRFGGGFPLSYNAGANYPGWLIDEYLLGKNIEFFEGWQANLLMLRYDAKVLIHGYY